MLLLFFPYSIAISMSLGFLCAKKKHPDQNKSELIGKVRVLKTPPYRPVSFNISVFYFFSFQVKALYRVSFEADGKRSLFRKQSEDFPLPLRNHVDSRSNMQVSAG
jgi:hypothetical protein